MAKTNVGKMAQAIGEKLAGFERRVFGWIGAQLSLTPDRFAVWLAERNFRRNEGTPAHPRYVVDYAGFARFARNAFFALLAWTLCFELYAIVLGTSRPDVLGTQLAIGTVIFFVSWFIWLYRVVYRINHGLFLMAFAVSGILALVMIGAPALQYYDPGQLAFLTPQEVKNMVGAAIPRYWAVLGFVLNSLVILPLLWTLRLGPALVALVFSKGGKATKEILAHIRKLIPFGTPESEEAAEELRERANIQMFFLQTSWAALALLCASLFLTPTVWGIFAAAAIAMVSIIVIWLRDTWSFLGYFFSKVLYGVACGFLIFICVLHGLSLTVLFLLSAWTASPWLFALVLTCVLTGMGFGVYLMFTSVPAKEYEELANGRVPIKPYKKQVTGFNPDGTPIYGIVPPRTISFAWLKTLLLYGAIAVAAMVFLCLMLFSEDFRYALMSSEGLCSIAFFAVVIGFIAYKKA